MKDKKRYSEAFKLKVMEELQDGKWKTVAEAAQAYGVSARGVAYRQAGNSIAVPVMQAVLESVFKAVPSLKAKDGRKTKMKRSRKTM